MKESMLVPREKAAVGAFLGRAAKAIVSGAKKVDAKLEQLLDEAQGIKEGPKGSTSRTPGATATDRGAVVGKKRKSAYGNTKRPEIGVEVT